jgi:competence ComEA-like helix-hairpin-helix protein
MRLQTTLLGSICAALLAACGPSIESDVFFETQHAALSIAGPALVGFNAPENTSDPLGTDMAAFIRTATGSVDMALYKLTHPEVLDAILDAHGRGLRVRMVSDSVHRQLADVAPIYDLIEQAGIGVMYDYRSADMHHKFVVRDNRTVWMGSYNPLNMERTHAENALVINDRQVAGAFAREFAQMHTEGRFSNAKSAGSAHHFQVNQVPVDVFFSPKDDVQNRVVAEIQSAEHSIRFMSFSFSADPLADAMLARHAAGVEVMGVIDRLQANKRGGDFQRLLEAGVDVRKTAFSTFMHHKVVIIDEGHPSARVITGSYNFTTKANNRNDESIMILRSADTVDRYISEFQNVFGQCAPLVGMEVGGNLKITEVHANAKDESRGEFIEFVNDATVAASLEGLHLYDGDAWDRVVDYDGRGMEIAAGAVGVIIDVDYEESFPIAPGTRVFTVTNRTLGDGLTNSDQVSLYGVDRLHPIDTYSFPFNAGDGYSVVRTSLDSLDLEASWVRGDFSMGSAGFYPEPMDLNRADSSQLQQLEGLGTRLAARIIEYRNQQGDFCDTTDLKRVQGIGDGLLARWSHQVLARSPQACGGLVDINRAPEEELESLPGIGPSLAHRILEYRTAHGFFQQTDELMKVSGIGELKYARLAHLIIAED